MTGGANLKNELLKLKERVKNLRSQLTERSKLWYWYRENPRRFIKRPDDDSVKLTDMQALEILTEWIEDTLDEGNEKKKLEKIARIYAVSKPAFDEAKRVLELGSVVERLDSLRKRTKDTDVVKSLTQCYETAIGMYRPGVAPPELIQLSDGTYRLKRLDESDRPDSVEAESNNGLDDSDNLLHQLVRVRLEGLYIGGLQKTVDSLAENLKGNPASQVTDPTSLTERARFWISFSDHADAIESRMAEAVESIRPVDVSDIPPEFLITALRVYNHSFADFPLRYEPTNNRLVPG